MLPNRDFQRVAAVVGGSGQDVLRDDFRVSAWRFCLNFGVEIRVEMTAENAAHNIGAVHNQLVDFPVCACAEGVGYG